MAIFNCPVGLINNLKDLYAEFMDTLLSQEFFCKECSKKRRRRTKKEEQKRRVRPL